MKTDEYAAQLLQAFADVEDPEWFEALLTASLDYTQGNVPRALAMAQAAIRDQPAFHQRMSRKGQAIRYGRTWGDVVRYAAEGATPADPDPLPDSPRERVPSKAARPSVGSSVSPPPIRRGQKAQPVPPIPLDELASAAEAPWRGTGLNAASSRVLSLPDGQRFFAKRPVNSRGHFSESDMDVEHASHDILGMLGIADVLPAAVLDRGVAGGGKHVVTPFAEGENMDQIVYRLTGVTKATHGSRALELASEDPAVNAEILRLVRSVPPENIGNIAFGNWYINAADRHWNQYLYREGGITSIDYGYSLYPVDIRRTIHWGRPDALREAGGWTPSEFAALPVSRAVAVNGVKKGSKIAARLKTLARHFQPIGDHTVKKMLKVFEVKAAHVANILAEKPGLLKLGDFGIIGNLPLPVAH